MEKPLSIDDVSEILEEFGLECTGWNDEPNYANIYTGEEWDEWTREDISITHIYGKDSFTIYLGACFDGLNSEEFKKLMSVLSELHSKDKMTIMVDYNGV